MEELGLLFTNFEVEQQVQLLKPMSNVKSTQPLVIFPLVFLKQLSKQLFSPIRAIANSKHRNFSTFDVSSMLAPFFGDQGVQ